MTRTVAISPQSNSKEYLGLRSKLLCLLYQQRLEQEQLRRRIHDDIGQYLTSISINAGLLAKKGHPGPEKDLITAIISASKMACRSTHELTNKLGPGSSLAENDIEPELIGLVQHYDIDETQPKLSFHGVRFLDRAPTPLIRQVFAVFEQFLLLLVRFHHTERIEMTLSQPRPSQSRVQLKVVATGQRLCGELPALSGLEQEMRVSREETDLKLSTGSEEHLQQLMLDAGIPTDRSVTEGMSSSC
jgi:glucose-6-phosphate-specific signal transduction histidine kinase